MSAQSLTKGRAQAIVGMMVPWEASWARPWDLPRLTPLPAPTPTQLSAETFSWLWAPSLQTGSRQAPHSGKQDTVKGVCTRPPGTVRRHPAQHENAAPHSLPDLHLP